MPVLAAKGGGVSRRAPQPYEIRQPLGASVPELQLSQSRPRN
jgi:hypothetical protein